MQTIEITGRPSIVINYDRKQVESLFTMKWFKDDLTTAVESDGKPLWSGDLRDIVIRQATDEEVSRWEIAFAQAQRKGEVTDDLREGYLALLVTTYVPASRWL
jgi:hypothetical protein